MVRGLCKARSVMLKSLPPHKAVEHTMPKRKPKPTLVAVSDTRMKGSGDDSFSPSLFSSCSAPLVAVSDTHMKGSGDDTFSLSLFSSCSALLEKLMSHHHGWLFNEPVDVKKLRLTDYYAVIRHPMDLGTVKCRVHKGRYNSPLQFADDVRLTFRNAMIYNRKDDTAYAMAEELLGIFESEWPSIEALFSDGKIEKGIDSVKKQGLSCKIEVIEEEWEIKPSKIARKVSSVDNGCRINRTI